MGELLVATATAKMPKIEGRAAQARFFCRPQWQKKKGWFFNKHTTKRGVYLLANTRDNSNKHQCGVVPVCKTHPLCAAYEGFDSFAHFTVGVFFFLFECDSSRAAQHAFVVCMTRIFSLLTCAIRSLISVMNWSKQELWEKPPASLCVSFVITFDYCRAPTGSDHSPRSHCNRHRVTVLKV